MESINNGALKSIDINRGAFQKLNSRRIFPPRYAKQTPRIEFDIFGFPRRQPSRLRSVSILRLFFGSIGGGHLVAGPAILDVSVTRPAFAVA